MSKVQDALPESPCTDAGSDIPRSPHISASVEDIIAERRRQVEVEGWTPEHDDEHGPGVLASAAAAYALGAMWSGQAQQGRAVPPRFWPWNQHWWKPRGGRDDLVRAGALIVAEIERLDRAAIAKADGRS